ncbi:ABC transporter ATP-binding protein [Thermococcus sp.]|uniref:ABC transporter ATP-binding protein n=1 Tax=Thermococcus sp. TaxID=35749 RepID=UPI002628FC70|nr:ABC transporter ATP-binding protein [Thermococcus sp.]
MLLECSNLSKSYGDVKALDGTSFSLAEGLSLILGPNGSGKTTFLKILSGVVEPDRGEILIKGVDYKRYPTYRVGFSFEKTLMSPRVRIREYLEAIADYRGKDNVDEIIEMFGLEGYQGAMFKELSQGYKRRFLVATAFAGDPDVVFLDEPFSNLDIVSKVELSKTFQEIKRKVSIVIVSHIISGLRKLDSIVLLHNGRVILNKIGGDAGTIGGFRALFSDGTVVENNVNELVNLIRMGKEPTRIEPVTPEDIMYGKLTQTEDKG